MYYSDLVKKACSIMFDAHKEDFDKSGYPYVFHPYFLATQMEDEDSVCVALMHDVIEDHGDRYTFESLTEMGFGSSIIDALKLLTHDNSVPYMEYVKAIAANPIARKVKMADLRHNLDTRRLNGAKPRKYDTYVEALKFLESIKD